MLSLSLSIAFSFSFSRPLVCRTDYVAGRNSTNSFAHVEGSILLVLEVDRGASAIGASAAGIDCIDGCIAFANIQLEKIADTEWRHGERDDTMAIEHRRKSQFD